MRIVKNAVLFGMMVLCAAGSMVVAGPKMEIDKDSWLRVRFLGQPYFQYVDEGADREDFYLRRGRIIVDGQIMDGVGFFAETDNANTGKNGVGTVDTSIQDAYIDAKIFGSHRAQAGLILLPFSFETRASAAKLLGIDYNVEAIKLVNSYVWRDYGAEVSGQIADKIDYRVGAFDGYDKYSSTSPAVEKNAEAPLRVTGHLALYLIGKADPEFFFTQNDLGKGSFLAIGAGYDIQNDATATVSTNAALAGIKQDSEAWVVDLQSAFTVKGAEDKALVSFLLNGAYYSWDSAVYEGETGFAEGGVLVGKIMPTVKYTIQDSDTKAAVEDYTAGISYFMKSHNARGGVEYRWGDSVSQVLVGLQFLL